MKATFVKQRNGTGDGRVYRVDPPMAYEDRTTEYVWVSATYVPYSGYETYIFPSDKHGNVLSWLELNGSFQGSMDHELALNNAGYTVE